MKRLILFTTCLFLSICALAQESNFGLNFGYGKSAIGHSNNRIITPFDKGLPNLIRIGLNYSFKPKKAIFNITTGINFDHKSDSEKNLNFLRIPVNMEFVFGERIQFIVAVGPYMSYLLSYDIPYNNNGFSDSNKNLQLGVQGYTGVGVELSNTFIIQFVFQQNIDVTKIYESNGLNYTINEYGRDGFIKACLIYKIRKQ